MISIPFESFVKALVALGFDKADPELKMFYLVIEGKTEELEELLNAPIWKDENYDKNITDSKIVARYQSLIKTAWVEKKLNEIRVNSN